MAPILRLSVLLLPLVVCVTTLQPVRASPYGAEYDAAFRAMMENPADLDTIFAYAVIARRSGDLEGAIGALERMLIFNPDLPIVHYELARLYAQLGSNAAARRYFQSALQLDPPADVRTRIEAEIARLERAMRTSLLSGSVLVGVRYQTNANAGPDEPTVRVGGLDARLADEFLDEEDFSAVASAQLAHRYDLGRDPAVFVVSELQVFGARQSEATENNIEFLAVSSGPEFMRSGDVSIRPSVRGDLARLGGDLFYHSLGGGISVRGTPGSASELRYFVDAAALYRDFNETERASTLDRRDGANIQLVAGLEAAISPRSRITGSIGSELQNGRVDAESYAEGRVEAQFLKVFPGAFGLREWSFSATGRAGIRRYEEPDPTIDPGRSRRDTDIGLSVALGVPLTDTVLATIECRQQWRRSNLPNFVYEDTSVLAGVRLAF